MPQMHGIWLSQQLTALNCWDYATLENSRCCDQVVRLCMKQYSASASVQEIPPSWNCKIHFRFSRSYLLYFYSPKSIQPEILHQQIMYSCYVLVRKVHCNTIHYLQLQTGDQVTPLLLFPTLLWLYNMHKQQ